MASKTKAQLKDELAEAKRKIQRLEDANRMLTTELRVTEGGFKSVNEQLIAAKGEIIRLKGVIRRSVTNILDDLMQNR